ncbi:MAG TPA: hypothetical protein VF760_09205 [Xanthobacteraceae bacterium]
MKPLVHNLKRTIRIVGQGLDCPIHHGCTRGLPISNSRGWRRIAFSSANQAAGCPQKIAEQPAGIARRLLVCSADMPRDSPMQSSLSRLPGMKAVEPMVMHSEYNKLPVLRAECCIGPNAAKAAVKPWQNQRAREALHRN